MQIAFMSSEPNKKYATISLNYSEIRDVANALYHVTSKTEPDQDYSKIATEFKILFDLVKYGKVMSETM